MPHPREKTKTDRYTLLLLGVIIILTVGSVYGIYRAIQTIRRPAMYEEVMICEECGHAFVGTYREGETSPFKCEKCGKKAAYTAYQCLNPNCGAFFLHKYPRSGAPIECPYCFGTNVRQLTEVPKRVDEPEDPNE